MIKKGYEPGWILFAGHFIQFAVNTALLILIDITGIHVFEY